MKKEIGSDPREKNCQLPSHKNSQWMDVPGPVWTHPPLPIPQHTHNLLHIYRLTKRSQKIPSFRKYQEMYKKSLQVTIGKVKKYFTSFCGVWEYVWKVDIKIFLKYSLNYCQPNQSDINILRI